MDPGRQASRALAAPLLATGAAGIGAWAADSMGLEGVDARLVCVIGPAAATLALARLSRPGASRGARLALAIACAPWLAAFAWPRSSLAVTWLSGGALVLGLDAAVHAARTAAALGSTATARAGLGALAILAPTYLLAAAAVVLVNTQLAIAPVRLAHQRPTQDAGETPWSLRAAGGVTLDGTLSPGGDGPLWVLHHGVSDGRERFLPWARRLRREGSPSLRYDARAHGRSGGAVCTYGQRERHDLVAAVRALRERFGPARPVVVAGTSMGGGTVLAASRALEEAGAVALVVLAPASRYPELVHARTALLGPLETPILNASARLARAAGQVPMTEWEPARGLSRALPITVLHGDADATIPIALSRRLARAHENVQLIELEGVGHDEIPGVVAGHDEVWSRVRGALSAASSGRRGSSSGASEGASPP